MRSGTSTLSQRKNISASPERFTPKSWPYPTDIEGRSKSPQPRPGSAQPPQRHTHAMHDRRTGLGAARGDRVLFGEAAHYARHLIIRSGV